MTRKTAFGGETINGKDLSGPQAPVPGRLLALRLTGALLALAVSAVHVADQGGVAAFTSPDWLGWAYRLIEVGGVLTAVVLLLPRLARLGWAAGALLGAGPFLGYLVSRTIGVPSDSGDVGNWDDWVGTVSLFVEAGLVVLAVGMLMSMRQRHGVQVSSRPLVRHV